MMIGHIPRQIEKPTHPEEQSRLEEARRVAQEHIDDLREILKNLRKRLN